jgi:hypothetical protein
MFLFYHKHNEILSDRYSKDERQTGMLITVKRSRGTMRMLYLMFKSHVY